MERALKNENLENITEKLAQTAEDLKAQGEEIMEEGRRLMQRAAREVKAEFNRHPVATVLAGAAIAGAIAWLITRK